MVNDCVRVDPLENVLLLNYCVHNTNLYFYCLQPHDDEVKVIYKLRNLKPHVPHGIHIHEIGDMTQSCNSIGGHYNPTHKHHGKHGTPDSHVGDLGSIEGDEHTVYTHTQKIHTDLHDLIGRSIAINAGADDSHGSHGGPVACCVIGRSHDGHQSHHEDEHHNVDHHNDDHHVDVQHGNAYHASPAPVVRYRSHGGHGGDGGHGGHGDHGGHGSHGGHGGHHDDNHHDDGPHNACHHGDGGYGGDGGDGGHHGYGGDGHHKDEHHDDGHHNDSHHAEGHHDDGHHDDGHHDDGHHDDSHHAEGHHDDGHHDDGHHDDGHHDDGTTSTVTMMMDTTTMTTMTMDTPKTNTTTTVTTSTSMTPMTFMDRLYDRIIHEDVYSIDCSLLLNIATVLNLLFIVNL
ncbi:histidine-rich glycoprotein-like [Pecten maximus]|uniref:histidine-rich glycoprotein-like n=1 Tax=Pecten maximus TaxID=6579 RepID=UPI0014587C29|nr:histidine-rich glycoprotein-like [Pecten maximus]